MPTFDLSKLAGLTKLQPKGPTAIPSNLSSSNLRFPGGGNLTASAPVAGAATGAATKALQDQLAAQAADKMKEEAGLMTKVSNVFKDPRTRLMLADLAVAVGGGNEDLIGVQLGQRVRSNIEEDANQEFRSQLTDPTNTEQQSADIPGLTEENRSTILNQQLGGNIANRQVATTEADVGSQITTRAAGVEQGAAKLGIDQQLANVEESFKAGQLDVMQRNTSLQELVAQNQIELDKLMAQPKMAALLSQANQSNASASLSMERKRLMERELEAAELSQLVQTVTTSFNVANALFKAGSEMRGGIVRNKETGELEEMGGMSAEGVEMIQEGKALMDKVMPFINMMTDSTRLQQKNNLPRP